MREGIDCGVNVGDVDMLFRMMAEPIAATDEKHGQSKKTDGKQRRPGWDQTQQREQTLGRNPSSNREQTEMGVAETS